MTDAPESPEVVGARARERVARHCYARRPVVRSIVVVAPSVIRTEQTPQMPHVPQRYAPVSLAVAPFVAWDDPAVGTALAADLAGIVAAVEGASGEVNALGARRAGEALFDADDHVSGAR